MYWLAFPKGKGDTSSDVTNQIGLSLLRTEKYKASFTTIILKSCENSEDNQSDNNFCVLVTRQVIAWFEQQYFLRAKL